MLNPFVIALLITLGILLCLPNYFSKYQLIEDKDLYFNPINNKFYYEDLNGDGFSERIILMDNGQKDNTASYMFYNSSGDFIDQFNLDTKFPVSKTAWFQDANSNGIKEMYLLTSSNDSVFLNSFEHISYKNPVVKKIFIDKMTSYKGVFNLAGGRKRKLDFSNYDTNFIHFTVSVGYGGNPRSVYRYNPKDNSILKSPHVTNSGSIEDMVDLDNDGKNEILFQNFATANTIDTLYTKRSDYKTWLTVLDDDLQFLFPPIGFNMIGGFTSTTIEVNGKTEIIALLRSNEHKKIPSKLLYLSATGKILKEKILPKGTYESINHISEQTFLVSNKLSGEFYIINKELEIIDTIKSDFNSGTIYNYDINKNGAKEWICYDYEKSTLSIFDFELKNNIFVNLPRNLQGFVNIGVRYPESGDSQIYLQSDRSLYIFSYTENPYYYFKYGFYLGIYALILFITFIIAKGQKLRENKKRAIEQQIADLQLKTIKNQVDPHFVFNAMNTISEMSLQDNKLEIDRFISRFSNFMRSTLAHSDKISTSIKEEIAYTENFIKLQQIRHQHQFDYVIEIENSIDQSLKIPKHCIFTYAENALKYGLPSQEKGQLTISIYKEKKQVMIRIEDNGPGFGKEIKKQKGTGNGLKIMNKIFALYENRYKTKITQQVTELKENNHIKEFWYL